MEKDKKKTKKEIVKLLLKNNELDDRDEEELLDLLIDHYNSITESRTKRAVAAMSSVGRYIYETEAALMTALRVRKIVTVPIFEGVTFTGTDSETYNLAAIIINPIDYNIGADKGGAVNMFDDFDIDYNQMKYLIETRISGALVKPKSAIIIGTKDPETNP